MDFKAILKKMLAGKELSAEEKSFMENYDPAKDDNKIPKSRLDAEITKRKEAEDKAAKLESDVEEIKAKLDEKDEKDLSEIEKLTKAHDKEKKALESKIKDLTSERDTASTELSGLKFKSSISELAAKHNFKSTEYLAYLVKQKGEDLDIKDEAAVKGFMEDLKKNEPNQFKVDANPGAGSEAGADKGGNDKFVEAKEKGDVETMLANAPEIKE